MAVYIECADTRYDALCSYKAWEVDGREITFAIFVFRDRLRVALNGISELLLRHANFLVGRRTSRLIFVVHSVSQCQKLSARPELLYVCLAP